MECPFQLQSSGDHKSSKSMESHFFRPFDTNMLPNGYHGSQISDYEKYSNYKNSLERHKAEKSRHTDQAELSHSHKSSHEQSNDVKHRHNHTSHEKGSSKSSHSSSHRKSTNQIKGSDHVSSRHHSSENHGKSSQSSDSKTSHYSSINLNNLPFASTLLFQQHDLGALRPTVAVSKLDLEEKRLREKQNRANSDPDYVESEDDDRWEDTHNARLLFITQGPPLKLDTCAEKMRVMNALGLTSQKVKQGMYLRDQIFITFVAINNLFFASSAKHSKIM